MCVEKCVFSSSKEEQDTADETGNKNIVKVYLDMHKYLKEQSTENKCTLRLAAQPDIRHLYFLFFVLCRKTNILNFMFFTPLSGVTEPQTSDSNWKWTCVIVLSRC